MEIERHTCTRIRCSAVKKKKDTRNSWDSIKMLIPPARMVETFVPRCLFLIFPLDPPPSFTYPAFPFSDYATTPNLLDAVAR
ncbi:hypothetical protein PUN28_018620 [Cardiocondyla obscurior]|uniref:Uncharacterized protein n=1 Tax=Cardiocondyla obscurior TaxID=286306 RepID=A0AAW2EIL2_9HYME